MQQQPYQSSPFQAPGATTAALDGLNETSQPFLDGFAAELLQGQGSLPLGDDLFAGLPQPAFPASPHPSPAANGLQYVQVASGVPLGSLVATQHVFICARPRRTESHACILLLEAVASMTAEAGSVCVTVHYVSQANSLPGYAQPLGAQPLGGFPPAPLGASFPPIPRPPGAQQPALGAQHTDGQLRRASDSFGSSGGVLGAVGTPRQTSSGGSDGAIDIASEVIDVDELKITKSCRSPDHVEHLYSMHDCHFRDRQKRFIASTI